MARSSDGIELTLLSKPRLLMTESAEDFAAFSEAVTEEIKPRGMLQRIFLAEFNEIHWEILRLRRCKAVIINIAFKDVLSETVYRLAGEPAVGTPEMEWVDGVSRDWFSKPKARKEVLNLLNDFGLDESAIEAEAIRSVYPELEVLDKMLALLESRRNKALQSIEDCQDRFAKQVREFSDRVIEGEPVMQLENQSARRSA